MNGGPEMRSFFSLATVLASCSSVCFAQDQPHDVPISKLGSAYRLIGDLHEPLGTVVTVQGLLVVGHSKAQSSSPLLRIQRINSRFVQESIEINLSAMAG